LLQTFGTDLGEISLQPATGGIFKVHLYDEEPGPTEVDEAAVEEHLLWDRKAEGGFPGMSPIYFPSIALPFKASPKSARLYPPSETFE
jgi:predicted Rdx family selenoprotein